METKELPNLALLFRQLSTFLKNLKIEDPVQVRQLEKAKGAMKDILTIIYTEAEPFNCSGGRPRVLPPL